MTLIQYVYWKSLDWANETSLYLLKKYALFSHKPVLFKNNYHYQVEIPEPVEHKIKITCMVLSNDLEFSPSPFINSINESFHLS